MEIRTEDPGDCSYLHDNIDPQRHCTYGPEKHHESRQTVGLLLPPVVPYLREQLDTPENGANGAKDVCRDGDGSLRCHCLFYSLSLSLCLSHSLFLCLEGDGIGSICKETMGDGSAMQNGSKRLRRMRARFIGRIR